MGKALNKLSDSTLKKLVAVQAEKERFYSDGGGLEIKHSKGGKLTWYSGTEREAVRLPQSG